MTTQPITPQPTPTKPIRDLFHNDDKSPEVIFINKWIKSFKEFLPLISVFIIFVSFLRLHAYYSYYRVDIINFIDLSELIAPIINDIFTFILWVIISGIIFFGFSKIITGFAKWLDQKRERKGYLISKIKLIENICYPIIALTFTFGLLFLAGFLFINATELLNIRLFKTVAMCLFGLMFILSLLVIFIKRGIYQPFFLIGSAFLSFGVGSIYDGRTIAEEYYDKRNLHSSIVQFDGDSTNYCSQSKWLIGLTDDYAIFWNELNLKPEIRKRDEINILTPSILPIKSMTILENEKKNQNSMFLIKNWTK